MAQFELGGETIVVSAKSRYYWFYRRQGLSIQVSPKSHWWCLWLCTDTTEIDAIRCSVVLTSEVVSNYEASGSCTDCGGLTIWGPKYWGASVPQAYSAARYDGVAVIDDVPYPFNGVEFFGTPPNP
jgi:hypothetical protein